MSQTIDGTSPQVTQSGNIINCHGAAACPLHSANMPESKHQAEFAARTKIWCPAKARDTLENLMAQYHFTAPRLHMAWQANNLCWDDDRAELVAKTHWLEALYGYGVAALMLVYFLVQGVALILSHEISAPNGLAAFFTAMVIYLGTMWALVRFVIIPYQVAQRAKPFLDEINGRSDSKK